MTETEARRAVEILLPYFPVAEVVRLRSGWCVKTYGEPPFIFMPESVGHFIVGKIRDADPDIDDRDALDAQDQKQAAREERQRTASNIE